MTRPILHWNAHVHTCTISYYITVYPGNHITLEGYTSCWFDHVYICVCICVCVYVRTSRLLHATHRCDWVISWMHALQVELCIITLSHFTLTHTNKHTLTNATVIRQHGNDILQVCTITLSYSYQYMHTHTYNHVTCNMHITFENDQTLRNRTIQLSHN